MPYQYHTIFSEVAELIASQYNINDTATNELYLNIVKNLGPDNDYTFQQIMLEYLTEFQMKSLFFFHRNLVGHNGFHVKKQGNALVVSEVNADNRLVVGDIITKMSQDEIPVLESRYSKLLFHEDDTAQDWTHIISKQSQMTVVRGKEDYEFDIMQFVNLPENTVKRYERYQIVTIYNFDEIVTIDIDLPVILDLRYARGINRYEYDADVILMSGQTKGSPEYFIAQSPAEKIGETTFGAANNFETKNYDDFVFVYGTEEESVVKPDKFMENIADTDELMDAAKLAILS
ncbi:hypothetical protein ACMGE9_00855 [Macrococcus sp. EM39E]|uniref:hypothetical protein n=1 Tax=Macrococcus animalis TaxID=3395467 RepID=UPI0039BEBC17